MMHEARRKHGTSRCALEHDGLSLSHITLAAVWKREGSWRRRKGEGELKRELEP
jgi:hypothetical protein